MEKEIEGESYRDVIARILDLSKSYTPEWRFDPDNPDIGSALAVVYARMVEQTYKRLSRVPEKNRIAFLNSLGADLLPAVPASGHVQFLLVNEEVEGAEVDEGTVVFADSEDAPDNVVAYETKEPLYVTPAGLSGLYVTHDEADAIVRLYDREEEEWKPVQLFGVSGKNSQCHELYIAHDTVLAIEREAQIELEFLHVLSPQDMKQILYSLADPSVAVWEYATGEGSEWQIFQKVDATAGSIRLYKAAEQPAFAEREIEGRSSYWIRVRLLSIAEGEKLRMTGMKLASAGVEVLPDIIYGADEEQDRRRCLPFGERLDLYRTVCFGSDEILSKKGAMCTLSFRVDFARVPLETNESQTFNWEWVMRRSDFKPNYEFDVSIDKVVWEYFNGTGWTRLFATDEHEHAFSVPDGVSGQYETLTFLVPTDIEPTLVGATETCFVRARILKIRNLYKLQGQYVLPVIESISMKYDYRLPQSAQDYILHNNLVTIRPPQAEEGLPFTPFCRTGTDEMAGYFAFDVSPAGGPVKILFDVVATNDESSRQLLWEYFSGDKWRPINLIDETAQLTKTGVVTFTIPPDISRYSLFGREGYWLRLKVEDGFDSEWSEPLRLNRIFMNVTPARETGGHYLEYFRTEIYQPEGRLDLPGKNILEAEVWVDEQGRLSSEEIQRLKQQEMLEEEYEDDRPVHTWVRWTGVEDFYDSDAEDRHYVLHPLSGQIEFGDGKRGRIPHPSSDDNIRVFYTTGGGAFTNVPVGAIDRMEQSIGFINRVKNVTPMLGGCDAEDRVRGIWRETEALGNQNRAITAADFESLAKRASREIDRVKCFSGFDGDGKRKTGAITLVVQDENPGENLHFSALRDLVLQYMKEHINPVLTRGERLFVVQPAYVECQTYIELTVGDLNRVFRVKKEIEERIAAFLDPTHGRGGGGWEIGSFPNTIQIQNVISDIRGISYISKVIMTTYGLSGKDDRKEVDIRTLPRNKYILPVPGSTEIVINANG